MAEKSRAERWVTNIAVVTSIMAVVGGLYAAAKEIHGPFRFPWVVATPSPSAAATPTMTVNPAATAAAPSTTAIPSPAPTTPRPIVPTPAPTAPSRPRADARFSNRVRLRDGEQSVMLQGRLAVGISFTAIGSTTLATLRIAREGEERAEALIPLQRQFIVELGGRKYSVATVAVDLSERTAIVQVDELGAARGGRT